MTFCPDSVVRCVVRCQPATRLRPALDSRGPAPKLPAMPPGDGATLRATLQTLFGADLVIERELGRGGMAAVFSAFDPGLQRRVAVKMLLPEIASDQEVAERFVREGHTMASLHHPHVVAVYGVRSSAVAAAIVMQFVEGRTLDVVLAEHHGMPLADAGVILSQVAAGLQHAHERGVVHRDVKPANILIDGDGRAVVSDFGIARRNDSFATTKTGIVLGTSNYMSPEQRSGERVTAATDQYAFGVMAFEVLAGRLPFAGQPGDVIRGHMVEAPPSLRGIRPQIPPAVEALVNRMLAKDPKERLPSLADAEHVLGTMTSATVSHARARTIALATAALILVGALGTWTVLDRRAGADARSASGASVPPGAAPLVNRTIRDSTGAKERERKGMANPRANALSAALPPASVRDSPVVPSPPQITVVDTVKEPSVTAPDPTRAGAAAAPPLAEPTAMAATLADARQLGRAFVAMLNQRRVRELVQLPAVGGDAVTRAELIRLTESVADFAAGFDRLPSAPAEWTSGFETELYLDLEWRGGKRILKARLYAMRGPDGWRLVAFGIEPAV